MNKILVIGASNIDIIGVSNAKAIEGDSNPGKIELLYGGVGKNIAENLFRLGEDVELLTFIGGGSFGKANIEYFKELGIPFNHSLINPDKECGKYLAIHDYDGVMLSGVNDFSFIESITKADFLSLHEYINSFDILVIDTNLSEEVLEYLIKQYQNKILIVDGVSQTKVKRIIPFIPYIDLLKVNVAELSSILGKKVEDVILGVRTLIEREMKSVVVTNGTEPITYNIDSKVYQTLIFEPEMVVSSVGAGDALLSGVIYGISHKKSMHEAINLGKKASALTMEVRGACNPGLNSKSIEE